MITRHQVAVGFDHPPPPLGLEPIGRSEGQTAPSPLTPTGNHPALSRLRRSPTMMQIAGYHTTSQMSQFPARSAQQPSTESIRTSVAQLLSQIHNLPCSKAAQAFTQLLPHISRFQLALDALLPSLDEGNEVCGHFQSSPSRSLP